MGRGYMGEKTDRLSEQFLKQARRSKGNDETLEERLLRESQELKAKSDKRKAKYEKSKDTVGEVFIGGVKYTNLSEEKAAEIRARIDDDVNNREARKKAERAEKRATAKERKAAQLAEEEAKKAAEFKAMIARRAKEQIALREAEENKNKNK